MELDALLQRGNALWHLPQRQVGLAESQQRLRIAQLRLVLEVLVQAL